MSKSSRLGPLLLAELRARANRERIDTNGHRRNARAWLYWRGLIDEAEQVTGRGWEALEMHDRLHGEAKP
jgi:hypothetical protein